jgi:hypothetical protein
MEIVSKYSSMDTVTSGISAADAGALLWGGVGSPALSAFVLAGI